MQRCILKFENAIKSEATKHIYKYQLGKFLEWTKLKDYNALLEASDKEIQTLLEDYLFHIKTKVSPNSVPAMMSPIELFYTMSDKIIDSKKLHRMYPSRIKLSGYTAYSNKDVQDILASCNNDKRNRAIVLFLASTGCRIGALPGLKISHVSDMQDKCKAILFYENSLEEYYGFLTPEANKALEEYFELRRSDGEHLDQQSPLFRGKYSLGIEKPKPMKADTITHVLIRLVSHTIKRNKTGKRYNIQIAHGLRKRFATIIKLGNVVSYSVSERLLGHNAYLDKQYFRGTKDELFKEFQKVIPALTVDDNERLRLEKLVQDKKISELQEEKNKRVDIEKQMVEMERQMVVMGEQMAEMEKQTEEIGIIKESIERMLE